MRKKILPLILLFSIVILGYGYWRISDHQQSWGHADGPWKGPGPPLLVAADF
jgi:hypothetical protein